MSHRQVDKIGGGVPKTASTGGGGGGSSYMGGGGGGGGGHGNTSVRFGEKRPLPPPAPTISGSSSSVSNKKPKLAFSIAKKCPLTANNTIKRPQVDDKSLSRSALRQAFNSDSEEEEEIPKEVRMRMRNFGRDTPTSSGPNSFGKTKQGFCDAKHMFEKKLRAAAEKVTK